MLLQISVLLLGSAALALESCLNGSYFSLRQEPKMLLLNPGDTAIINCTVMAMKEEINHVYLRKRFNKLINIMPAKFEVTKEYENRLTFTDRTPHFTLTLKNLTEEDSDLYICDGKVRGYVEVHGQGTLIIVGKQEVIKEKDEMSKAQNPMYPILIVAAASCLFFCLAIFVYVRYKSLEKKKGNQNTYMDMTQTLRRNTMQSTNVYSQ